MKRARSVEYLLSLKTLHVLIPLQQQCNGVTVAGVWPELCLVGTRGGMRIILDHDTRVVPPPREGGRPSQAEGIHWNAHWKQKWQRPASDFKRDAAVISRLQTNGPYYVLRQYFPKDFNHPILLWTYCPKDFNRPIVLWTNRPKDFNRPIVFWTNRPNFIQRLTSFATFVLF